MRYLVLALCAPVFAAPSLDRIPAWFEPNAGQFSSSVKFYSRSANGTVFLEDSGPSFRLPGKRQIRMDLIGKNAKSVPSTAAPLTAKTNYFLGNDRSKWRTGVPHYSDVRYQAVYPGIDAVFYASGKHLEYDFVVAPGADPSAIRMKFRGARPTIDAQGNLVFRPGKGQEVKHLAPLVYQKIDDRRVEVPAKYAINRRGEVSFVLSGYDRTRELTIDPVLTYASYFGGGVIDQINASAVDKQGRLWVVGATYSQIDLPPGVAPPQETNAGDSDAFLAGIATKDDGTPQLIYYTYLGGASTDAATAISIDPYGYVNIAGTTNSVSFPLGGNANQISAGGLMDGFVAQIHPQDQGNGALFYCSYYGGESNEYPQAIFASEKLIAVSGYTDAGTLPGATDAQLQQSNRGGLDAFFFVTNPYSGDSASALRYASFLGGNGADFAPAIAIESSGTILIGGSTSSTDFPLAGEWFQPFLSGQGDGYLARIDINRPSLEALRYATYIGGRESESIQSMRLDASGAVWLTGYTYSPDFPTTIGAVQREYSGGGDIWVGRFDLTQPGVSALTYGTYIGGSNFDLPYGLAIDPSGRIWLAGYTNSSNYPRVAPPNPQPRVSITEGFITEIDPTISGSDGITLSMLYGAAGTDVITGISVDPNGNVYAGGYSTSSSLPTTNGSGKPNVLGLRSGFYLRLAATPAAQP